MKAFIGNSLISKLKPQEKAYDVWDDKLTGFIVRVYPSGGMVYRCEYARGKRITLGKTSVLTPAQARDRTREILADVVKGNQPDSKRRKSQYTLKEFIEEESMRHGATPTVNALRRTYTGSPSSLLVNLVIRISEPFCQFW